MEWKNAIGLVPLPGSDKFDIAWVDSQDNCVMVPQVPRITSFQHHAGTVTLGCGECPGLTIGTSLLSLIDNRTLGQHIADDLWEHYNKFHKDKCSPIEEFEGGETAKM